MLTNRLQLAMVVLSEPDSSSSSRIPHDDFPPAFLWIPAILGTWVFQALGLAVFSKHALCVLLILLGLHVYVLRSHMSPPYVLMTGLGFTVVLILTIPEGNRQAIIAVEQLLEAAECADIVVKAEEQASANVLHNSSPVKSRNGWFTARHSHYSTTDLAISDIPSLQHLERTLADERIFPLLADRYGVSADALKVLDMFVVKYDENGQQRLQPHRDKGQLTFNIALSSGEAYRGGGTRFVYFNRTVNTKQGQVMLHPAALLHEGIAITQGTRYILVGHVQVTAAPHGTWFPTWGYAASCFQILNSGRHVEGGCTGARGVASEIAHDGESNLCFTIASAVLVNYFLQKSKPKTE